MPPKKKPAPKNMDLLVTPDSVADRAGPRVVRFLCPQKPRLIVLCQIGRWRFEDGVLETDNVDLIKVLDNTPDVYRAEDVE